MSTAAAPRDRVGGTAVGGIALALGVAAVAWAVNGTAVWGADFEVYRAAGTAVLHGQSPYDFALHGIQLKFIYTPFAALLFAPLGLPGADLAAGAWTLLSVLALQGVVWLSLSLAGVASGRRRAVLTLAGTVAVLPLAPLLMTVWFGQINVLLLLLVLADLTRAPDRIRGMGVGIAAGIKLTPLIFIPYFLLTRRYRAAGVAGGTFLATILVGFLAQPSASWKYWAERFFDTSRIVPADGAQVWNYSIQGVLLRLPSPALHAVWIWAVAAAAVGAGGVAVAAWAARRGDEAAGILACAFTGLLVSPVSWPAHWVWCVPLLIVVAGRAWRSGSAAAKVGTEVLWMLLLAPTYWLVMLFLSRPAGWSSLWPPLLGRAFVGLGVLALAALAAVFWSRPATPSPVGAPPGRFPLRSTVPFAGEESA
jgi:alpha-1,2-mannosyltransferase